MKIDRAVLCSLQNLGEHAPSASQVHTDMKLGLGYCILSSCPFAKSSDCVSLKSSVELLVGECFSLSCMMRLFLLFHRSHIWLRIGVGIFPCVVHRPSMNIIAKENYFCVFFVHLCQTLSHPSDSKRWRSRRGK